MMADPRDGDSLRVTPSRQPGPTNWYWFNLDQMYQMVARESPSYNHAASSLWRRTAELCEDEATQLEQALRRLEEQWPRTQQAARAFLNWGEQLVRAMRVSADVGQRNAVAIESITARIGAAKVQIEDLKAQDRHFADLKDGRAQPGADEMIPPPDWRLGLDEQARVVMRNLETDVYNESLRLQRDPFFKISPNVEAEGETFRPPGVKADTDDATKQAAIDASRWAVPTPQWYEADGTSRTSVATFDGGQTQLDGRPGTTVLPELGHVSTGSSQLPAYAQDGRVVAPGGAIGQPGILPSAGPGLSPQATPMTAPVTGGSGNTRTTGSGIMPITPPIASGPTSSRNNGQPITSRRRRVKADLFHVSEGVPPVLTPEREPADHDPGPGVIGVDR